MYRIDISWTNIDGVQNGSSSLTTDEVNGTVPETLNDIDYFDFTIYYGSENFEHFAADLTYVKLWSIKRNAYIWYGRVASVNEILSEEGVISKQIHCESEIAYLCDSVCDIPDVLKQMEDHHSYTPGDPVIADTFITALLDKHSQTVGAARRIYPPNCTWNSGGYFEIDEGESTGYPTSTITESLNIDTGSTFSVLKALRDKQGWDIWCEHTDGKTYLKVGLAGSREQGTSGDVIKLRNNMRSLTVERAPVSEGRVTRIIPLGGVGADGKRLNIASVNDYKRYLENRTLVAKYGNIDMVVLYDDLVDDGNMTAAQLTTAKNELKSRGQQKLDLLTGGITGIKCRAVDLYEAGQFPSYTFKVGGLYAFDCSFLGLDEYNTSFRLYQKTTDLAAPYDPELVFVLPNATYLTQVTNERMRIQQKLYAQAKAQADRMDSTSIKRTTSAAYDPTTANPDTVYYVDKGNGTGELMLDGTSYGGGGGGGTTVENAAILTDDTFSDYAVDNELIVNLEPDGHIYYGLDTGQVGMCIVQGRYCVWGGSTNYTPTYTDGVWKIFGSEELYETLINNIDKLSSQWGNYDPEHPELGGGWLFQANSTPTTTYPQNTKQVMIEVYNASKSGSGINYSSRLKLRHFVNDPPVGDKWWEETMTHSSPTSQYSEVTLSPNIKSGDGTTVFKNRLTDLVIVPVVRSYSGELTYGSGETKVDTPYGYAHIHGFLLLAQDGSNGWGATITSGTTYWYQDDLGCVPLISEAEKAFLLGITKKTEPIPGA